MVSGILTLLCIFSLFAENFHFTFIFKVYDFSLKHFNKNHLRVLLDNSNICVILALVCTNCLFPNELFVILCILSNLYYILTF